MNHRTTGSWWFEWFVVESLFFAQDPMQREKINDIIKEKEEINMAATLLREISQDEHERAKFLSRKKYEMDMYSNLHTAIENGELRGEQRERDKWQGVVAEKDSIIANKEAENEQLRSEIAELKALGDKH